MSNENVCFSGGALGADTLFGNAAKAAGHDVIHYHFEEKKRGRENFHILTEGALLLADPYLKRANKTLQRAFPTKSEHANGLLRRNFYQVKNSERVYAACPIVEHQVQGGTAWAVQMYIDIHESHSEVYIFNVVTNRWETFDWLTRTYVECRNVPAPRGLYTGIGSRPQNLTADAMDAIYDLYA